MGPGAGIMFNNVVNNCGSQITARFLVRDDCGGGFFVSRAEIYLHACSCALGRCVIYKFLQDVPNADAGLPGSQPGWRSTGIKILNHL